MEYWNTISHNISPVTGYIHDYFTELGAIFANTMRHDIGFDVGRIQFIDSGTFLVALFSVLTPFVFFLLLSWCCGWRRRSSDGEDETDASNSQKYEAMRWYKQADYDLTAANSDLAFPGAYEWCCMKCQQAAEKAIKSALYATGTKEIRGGFFRRRTFDIFRHHDIPELANALQDPQLQNTAMRLQGITGPSSRMRYPDMHAYPHTPHDAYTEQQANASVRLATQILEHVRDNYLAGISFWQREHRMDQREDYEWEEEEENLDY